MKRLILITCLWNLLGFATIAQEIGANHSHSNREKLYIRENITLHFNSPEPIQYVDISSEGLVGDLPLDNVFRIKMQEISAADNMESKQNLGIVTIVGQKFIAQYEVQYASGNQDLPTLLEITPENMSPLGIGLVPLTQNELREFSMDAYKRKEDETGLYNSQYGITGNVNHIHTLEDYIFLDITYTNETNLKFDIDQIRFRVEDKKIAKATNVQSIEMAPVFTLFEKENFKRKYRNIYVLEKFSFPNNKVLSIELTEKQLSGRNLILEIDYFDLLSADTL
ncbi:conjugative transposon protein TraN [Cyclobacterium marinum]|uniref:conjugative transposon protein TraN n=1 Tax=Cyclobacterium marinum TaxID=104 RepID=UPI0011ECBBDA|nr:conjugative transposon protein TraN [Cyclobacterium marinum]MBI0397996.1 conjugative transposon protein TraN [Cyclobacterium marinum]